MVRLALRLTLPKLALIETTVVALTCDVPTVKRTVDCPAGTVTEAGTVAFDELHVKPIVIPPAGAGPRTETVPIVEDPPDTVLGLISTPPSAVASKVK